VWPRSPGNRWIAALVYKSVKRQTLLACLCLACHLGLPDSSTAGPPASASSGTVPIVLLRRSARKPPDGSSADVLVAANLATDEIARRASALLSEPASYGQLVLRLDRYARTYLLRDPATTAARRATLAQPAFLFLSDRQGGYPADTFWLEQPDGTLKEMRDVTFVDTVVDAHDLVPGTIDGVTAIYAHELGHLVMAALAGPMPRRAASGVHFITIRTDAWYAFTEGWGEHFQPMSLDLVHDAALQAARARPATDVEQYWYGRFAHEEADGCIICPANLRFLRWHGPGEQRLRDAPLRANDFIHRVPLPLQLLTDRRPPFDVRMYRDIVPPAPAGALKNGPEMMETEGVIATLFYRLASDERLKTTYREAAFYEPFVQPGQADDLRRVGPQGVILPAENIYLKMFDVMHRSFKWGDWPAIEFVKAYAAQFPDEAAAVYDAFLDVTRGVTVERAALTRQSEPGYLAALRDRLLSGEVAIDANQGRPIWMVSPSMTFGMGVFRYFLAPGSITFDLNSADVGDLRDVPGISASLAAAIVESRESRGAFASVDDLAGIPGITPELLSRFKAMATRMTEQMARPRTGGGDPGWLKDLLVPLLRGSYYAAGAWQFGVALVLAGAAFGLTSWLIGALVPGALFGTTVPVRRWWRRSARGLARGMLAVSIPCLASVGLYARDILPSPAIMGALGLLFGVLVVLAPGAARRLSLNSRLAMARVVIATTAASAVMGLMY